jgi:hypothetical protein
MNGRRREDDSFEQVFQKPGPTQVAERYRVELKVRA